ncbi:MAG: DNA-3-methyladenine glycosylase [Trueperaceae bacterium]
MTTSRGMRAWRETGAAPLPASFYRRTADRLAPDLLGKVLAVCEKDGTVRQGRIVEVEAYVGETDLACHASKGLTKRTRTLYGPPGTAYVYLVYGMHELFNVVAASEGEPHAVLVRAVELAPPGGDEASTDESGTEGASKRASNRATRGDGPGRLTRALGIDRRFDGADLTKPPITLHDGPPPRDIVVTPRVGVGYAGPWADAALRFVDAGSGAVSRPPRGAIGRRDLSDAPRRTRRAASG